MKTERPETIDLRSLKIVAKLLPPASVARRVILSGPDQLSRRAFIERAEVLASLLFEEQRSARIAEITARAAPRVGRAVLELAAEAA